MCLTSSHRVAKGSTLDVCTAARFPCDLIAISFHEKEVVRTEERYKAAAAAVVVDSSCS